jgi:hypothetical protein
MAPRIRKSNQSQKERYLAMISDAECTNSMQITATSSTSSATNTTTMTNTTTTAHTTMKPLPSKPPTAAQIAQLEKYKEMISDAERNKAANLIKAQLANARLELLQIDQAKDKTWGKNTAERRRNADKRMQADDAEFQRIKKQKRDNKSSQRARDRLSTQEEDLAGQIRMEQLGITKYAIY